MNDKIDTSAAEFARLARDVYLSGGKGSRVYSWTRQNFLGDPTNGFFAAAYQTPRTRKLTVAFRGTQPTSGIDWKNNALNTAGLSSGLWDSQLNTALAYFRAVRSIYPASACAVCGHSLGGFLASMVAIKEQVLGVTFNPAPLGLSGAGALLRSIVGNAPRIVNFRLKGDVVSGLRVLNIGTVIELNHSAAELWIRAPGLLGDLDPLMHDMALMEEAVLRHPNFDLAPERWVGLNGQ
jgi:pimeloyl-ACP methyl ester carboxylesterase